MNFLSAAHQLAWLQHPTIWLCESCAILWLVLRIVHSRWVGVGVLLMLCGLMLNALVTQSNTGTMPVIGMPSAFQPASQLWSPATTQTRMPLLADQARLAWFSVGDIGVIFGGFIILTLCTCRRFKKMRTQLDAASVAGRLAKNRDYAQNPGGEYATPLGAG